MIPLKRESSEYEPHDALRQLDARLERWFRGLPYVGRLEPRLPWLETHWPWIPDNVIPIDEYREGGVLVVRAEVSGIDPDKDVTMTVSEGYLRIVARRHDDVQHDAREYLRHEVRTGSFIRVVPLPEGVTEAGISADYKDGILTVRVTLPEPATTTEPTRISVTKG
jgi:HSP20 family protein